MLTLTTSLFNVHICIHDTKSIQFWKHIIFFHIFFLLPTFITLHKHTKYDTYTLITRRQTFLQCICDQCVFLLMKKKTLKQKKTDDIFCFQLFFYAIKIIPVEKSDGMKPWRAGKNTDKKKQEKTRKSSTKATTHQNWKQRNFDWSVSNWIQAKNETK